MFHKKLARTLDLLAVLDDEEKLDKFLRNDKKLEATIDTASKEKENENLEIYKKLLHNQAKVVNNYALQRSINLLKKNKMSLTLAAQQKNLKEILQKCNTNNVTYHLEKFNKILALKRKIYSPDIEEEFNKQANNHKALLSNLAVESLKIMTDETIHFNHPIQTIPPINQFKKKYKKLKLLPPSDSLLSALKKLKTLQNTMQLPIEASLESYLKKINIYNKNPSSEEKPYEKKESVSLEMELEKSRKIFIGQYKIYEKHVRALEKLYNNSNLNQSEKRYKKPSSLVKIEEYDPEKKEDPYNMESFIKKTKETTKECLEKIKIFNEIIKKMTGDVVEDSHKFQKIITKEKCKIQTKEEMPRIISSKKNQSNENKPPQKASSSIEDKKHAQTTSISLPKKNEIETNPILEKKEIQKKPKNLSFLNNVKPLGLGEKERKIIDNRRARALHCKELFQLMMAELTESKTTFSDQLLPSQKPTCINPPALEYAIKTLLSELAFTRYFNWEFRNSAAYIMNPYPDNEYSIKALLNTLEEYSNCLTAQGDLDQTKRSRIKDPILLKFLNPKLDIRSYPCLHHFLPKHYEKRLVKLVEFASTNVIDSSTLPLKVKKFAKKALENQVIDNAKKAGIEKLSHFSYQQIVDYFNQHHPGLQRTNSLGYFF